MATLNQEIIKACEQRILLNKMYRSKKVVEPRDIDLLIMLAQTNNEDTLRQRIKEGWEKWISNVIPGRMHDKIKKMVWIEIYGEQN